jgi:hypothetical protein
VQKLKIQFEVDLKAVLYRSSEDPKVWIAHALDFDILGHGKNHAEALRMLGAALNELISFRVSHNLPPFELIPAPPEVWKIARDAGMPISEANDPVVRYEAVRVDSKAVKPKKRVVVSDRAPALANAC